MTPAVRMLVREHGVDLSQITGSGIGGRITKKDVLEYVQQRDAGSSVPCAAAGHGARSGDSTGYVAYAGTAAGFDGANGGFGVCWSGLLHSGRGGGDGCSADAGAEGDCGAHGSEPAHVAARVRHGGGRHVRGVADSRS